MHVVTKTELLQTRICVNYLNKIKFLKTLLTNIRIKRLLVEKWECSSVLIQTLKNGRKIVARFFYCGRFCFSLAVEMVNAKQHSAG